MEALRSEVGRLRSNLGQAYQKIDELHSRLVPCSVQVPDDPEANVAVTNDTGFQQQQQQQQQQEKEGEVVDYADLIREELPDGRMELPPLHEVLFATEAFLRSLNTILPLFHPGRLLRKINHWYKYPERRERTTWAAINVVLALAHRHSALEDATLSGGAAYYLQNAQTVLSEIIMGEADLLSVQILLGMVLLFQGTQDLKPATMLIAIALRLAHELGLHTRSADSLDISMTLERNRVFWMAYLLDKDISMRTSRPPVQREADIDVDWPSAEPTDGAGNVTDASASFSFNFLRCRVQLASIQGEVRDFTHASAAGSLDDGQRDQAIVRLNGMLDDWMSSVPTAFRQGSVKQTGQQYLCRGFAVLYSTHLACRSQVYRAHAMRLQWIQSLRSFGKTVAQQGHHLPVPLPTPSQGEWHKLIDETRKFMILFWEVERRDQAFIWLVIPSHD